jgi:hypothetical protein
VKDVIDKTNHLIENHFTKSGLEDLHQRAFDLVQAAKAAAEKQLESQAEA